MYLSLRLEKLFYRWPCRYSDIFEFITTCWSLVSAPPPHCLCGSSWCRPHAEFTSPLTNLSPGTVHTLALFAPQSEKTATNKVHRHRSETRECSGSPPSRLQKPSESYWRDTWRHPSSALFPGRCCCCACAYCQSSDTACTWSPEEINTASNSLGSGNADVKSPQQQLEMSY